MDVILKRPLADAKVQEWRRYADRLETRIDEIHIHLVPKEGDKQ